jgi:hypothetical protein
LVFHADSESFRSFVGFKSFVLFVNSFDCHMMRGNTGVFLLSIVIGVLLVVLRLNPSFVHSFYAPFPSSSYVVINRETISTRIELLERNERRKGVSFEGKKTNFEFFSMNEGEEVQANFVNVSTFLGIRYSQPPIGPLRWQPPESIDYETGER